MAVISNTEDPVDIEKEAARTSAIASSVIDALPNILNGTFKLSQSPELCNLTLTYALYGKIVDHLKNIKQTTNLPIILKFLFPDLAQFLPPSIFILTTQVRRFINKAYRLGHLKSLYEPVSKLYTAKSNSEWADFMKWGISQDMLLNGPLAPLSGSLMQLTNRHVILLLNLRKKYRLCWVKVVPQWLRFFGILQADDCVQLQDIKGNWVGLSAQADKLKGTQLREFLDTPFTLPKSIIRKNIVPVTSSNNLKLPCIDQKKYISAYLKEKQQCVESLQKEVDKLKSQVASKDEEISAYQKRLSQTDHKLDHLETRLCKMRVLKNHWLMKYRSMSGINLFADDSEFKADLTYAQKIRDGARYIKRILQLRYSDQSSRFLDTFLDDSFIEELLETILALGITFDKSSNILSDILQELVKHSQRKFTDDLEWKESKNNSDLDSYLMHNKLVPEKNNSTATDDVLVISDDDDDNIEKNKSINKTSTTSSHDKTDHSQFIDLCDEEDSENHLGAENVDVEIPSQLPNSSGSSQDECHQLLSSKDSLSGLCKDEEMLHNAYILYDMVTHKRTHYTSEEPSKDSGSASQEDAITYQPQTKMIRLEKQKPDPNINSDTDPSSDTSLSPLFLETEPCSSPFVNEESYISISKPSDKDHNTLAPSNNNLNDIDSEFYKLQNNLWTLGDDYISSLKPNFGDIEDSRVFTFENTTRLDSPPCLILENPVYNLQTFEKPLPRENYLNSKIDSPPLLILEKSGQLETLDKDQKGSREKNTNSKINSDSIELFQDNIHSPPNIFDDFAIIEKKRKDNNLQTLDKQISQEKYLNSKIDSPPLFILENSEHLQTLDKDEQVSQKKSTNSKINSDSIKLFEDKIQSPSNDFTNTEKKRKEHKPKKKRGRKKSISEI